MFSTHALSFVRSLGALVSSGRPSVWISGQLPSFLGNSIDDVQISADQDGIQLADGFEDNVPIFVEDVQFDSSTIPGLAAAVADEDVAVFPMPGDRGDHANADSEHDDEGPLSRHQRLVREAQSLSEPKNPACEVCSRSIMHRLKAS